MAAAFLPVKANFIPNDAYHEEKEEAKEELHEVDLRSSSAFIRGLASQGQTGRLLEALKGRGVNTADESGHSVLFWAAFGKRFDTVATLVSHGAVANDLDRQVLASIGLLDRVETISRIASQSLS